VAARNADLKERQLDTEVRKPADAARYKLEQEAEAARNAAVLRADAERQATIAAAQAKSEQDRLTGEGERARRAAIADAVEREGTAEAKAIQARGEAEAKAMQAKADAFAKYGEAAVLDLLVRIMPQVVQAASAPLSAIDKLTVISTDGASSLTKTVASNVAQGLQLGTDLTGIDLSELLARLGGMATGGAGSNGTKAVGDGPAKALDAGPTS
jgi:flotillin